MCIFGYIEHTQKKRIYVPYSSKYSHNKEKKRAGIKFIDWKIDTEIEM